MIKEEKQNKLEFIKKLSWLLSVTLYSIVVRIKVNINEHHANRKN